MDTKIELDKIKYVKVNKIFQTLNEGQNKNISFIILI